MLANIAGSMLGLPCCSFPARYLRAMLRERFAPQLPFYVPLMVTLLLLPVIVCSPHPPVL